MVLTSLVFLENVLGDRIKSENLQKELLTCITPRVSNDSKAASRRQFNKISLQLFYPRGKIIGSPPMFTNIHIHV